MCSRSSEEGLRGKGRETGRKVNTPRNENLTEEKHTVAGFRSFPRLLRLSHRRLTSERGSRKKEEGTVLQAQDSKPVMMLRTQHRGLSPPLHPAAKVPPAYFQFYQDTSVPQM